MESLTKVEKRSEALQALNETYDAMAKFINRTETEKMKSVDVLGKIEALVNLNFEHVNLFIYISFNNR
jgi:hypothetical protein